jgi:hypothetical protein
MQKALAVQRWRRQSLEGVNTDKAIELLSRTGETMKVKNINGRRQNSCKCGTWLDHWMKISGWPLPQYCAASTCMAQPQLGAHVQLENETEGYWYIIPLCLKHSTNTPLLEIDDSTVFVSAHVNENCAKQMPIGNVWPQELEASITASVSKEDPEIAKVQSMLDRAKRVAPAMYSKRKPTRPEPPALALTY